MTAPYTIEVIDTLHKIKPNDWDACATDGHPFSSYAFLNALETSSSATAETGWAPHHFALKEEDGTLAAVLPCYLKNHSYGEYVFDHNWAEALYAAGGRYYPKLQCSIPFTPATCHKILVRGSKDLAHINRAMLEGICAYIDQTGISSFHATFLPEDEISEFQNHNFLIRHDIQYHWENDNYKSFADFLNALNARKRKAIRKEREHLRTLDLTVEVLEGHHITENHWDYFFEFYQDTGSRKWGQPYLTRSFFSEIGGSMNEKIVLIMAKQKDKYVAGALNFKGTNTLYGRYWGATQHHRFLHFELCYYQAIDYAIAHNLDHIEAGAQGQHKISRGYLPKLTQSAHYMREPAFTKAVDQFLKQERKFIAANLEALLQQSPFRKSC